MTGEDAGCVVVLGGSGFLGRHVCSALSRAGHDVLVLSRNPVQERSVSLDLLKAAPETLTDLLRAERAVTVVNAMGAVWRADPALMLETNARAVERIIDAVAGVPWRPRFVQLGSVHEYGLVPRGVDIDADTPLRPELAYGRTKLHGSRAVQRATEAGLLAGVVLRITIAIGPGAPPGSLLGGVAERLGRAMRDGERATLRMASLSAIRDFVDVRDVADAIAAAVVASVTGEVINIGSGAAMTARRLVEMLISLSGVPADLREEGGEQAPQTQWQQVDIRPASKLLDWAPWRPLHSSLQDLWDETVSGAGQRG